MSLLTGSASEAGVVSNACQFSRSFISAALQLGKQIEGAGVWRALSGSGASLGGSTVGCDVVGEVAAQPASSSPGSVCIGCRPRQSQVRVACKRVETFTVASFELSVVLGCA